jgi:hypothetical protein
MNTWPSTIPNPSFPLQHTLSIPQVRTPFEGGYVQSRRVFTRQRHTWRLAFEGFTDAHRTTLDNFFIANQGATFNWVHPTSAVTHKVRFSDDDLVWRLSDTSRWSVTINIEED